MELLEEPIVQSALASLDARISGVLASWEPPWATTKSDDLDADVLDGAREADVIEWVQRFAEVVSEMANCATAVAALDWPVEAGTTALMLPSAPTLAPVDSSDDDEVIDLPNLV
eukprot:NODE_28258_length_483_cov_4.693820.p1 GENE.NODE_28258_length_483_cov_4.693820~~NODE_28258_length_483_cov_4.693820.p1  ORF type:complete len:129 (+),score=39.05 NODE_28258_length_483_cov_4.693820:48-389(+)